MESKRLKTLAKWGCGILSILGVLFFGIAIFKGESTHDKTNAIQPIQVYINDNDSVIQQLQLDVEHLSSMLENMQNDSLVITVEKVKR